MPGEAFTGLSQRHELGATAQGGLRRCHVPSGDDGFAGCKTWVCLR